MNNEKPENSAHGHTEGLEPVNESGVRNSLNEQLETVVQPVFKISEPSESQEDRINVLRLVQLFHALKS